MIPLLLILSQVVLAETSERCKFEIECLEAGPAFTLQFRSPSGHCDNDDTSVLFKSGKVRKPLSIPPNWYFEISNIGNVPTKCKGTTYKDGEPLFLLPNHRALLFLRGSNRPSLPIISAYLFDYSKGIVLSSSTLGQVKGTLGILKTDRGYKMQIVKEDLKEMKCDCDAAFISDWLEVLVDKDQIKTAWMKPTGCESSASEK